ncbi:hypothetical protein N7475_007130 [Penicillium sp. IBT 31633x]|nr:hypothetical protein N7475_007130 [Penicillium sp. IBT 31633x]
MISSPLLFNICSRIARVNKIRPSNVPVRAAAATDISSVTSKGTVTIWGTGFPAADAAPEMNSTSSVSSDLAPRAMPTHPTRA